MRARGRLSAKEFSRPGLDLALAHTAGDERVRGGHGLQAGAQGVRFAGPLGKRLRPMEGKDQPRSGIGIALVAEEGFDSGRFIQEGQRTRETSGEKIRQAAGVAG
jgi:hypothetical protein